LAPQIDAVVFDLDNTLLRSKIGARRGLVTVAKLISKRLSREGYILGSVRLFRHLQAVDREMLGRKFRYNRDVWWKTLFKELGLKRMNSKWIHHLTLQYWKVYAANSPPFRDAEPTVRKLIRSDYKVGLVSDSDGTPGMKRKRIRQVRFHNLFEAIVVSGEDTPRVKPGHESFQLIAKKLGVQPKYCIYVGDNPRTDIEGAKAVGMISVIVHRRGNRGGDPDYRVRYLRAIPGLVRSIQRSR
jgi:putative hydrolase of the HAD superfamily